MTSNRPYLVRAIYEWIVDNGFTPHLLVDATADSVVVPTRFVEDGKIVLNVSSSSVRGLVLGNDAVTFGARFSGSHFDVHIPTSAVLAVYARENGKGLAFPGDDESDSAGSGDVGRDPDPDPDPDAPPPSGRKGPKLRVVK